MQDRMPILCIGLFILLSLLPENILADSTAAYWRLNEGSGSTVADETGHGFTGTLNGTPLWDTSGVSNNCINFNMAGYVHCSTGLGNFLGNTNKFSLSMWVNIDSITPNTGIFYMGDFNNNNNEAFSFTIYLSQFQYRFNNVSWIQYASLPALDSWHHVAITYDGSYVKFYLDGTLKETNNYSTYVNFSGKNTVYGSYYGTSPGWFFDGKIDEVKVFNTGLSQAEVEKLFSGSYSPYITSTPNTNATEDFLYTYNVDAVVDSGCTAFYSLTQAPDSMAIDSLTGLILWTPHNEDVGKETVTVKVADGKGGEDTQVFVITVVNTNDPPEIVSTPLTVGYEDSLYYYDVNAEDVDVGDVLTYSKLSGPDSLKINSSTGAVTWTPQASDVGTVAVSIRVSDGKGGTDTQNYQIVVHHVNHPPSQPSLLSPPDGTQINETGGLAWSACTDPDGDPFVYRVEICTSQTFASPAVIEDDLTKIAILIDSLKQKNNLLNLTIYYWRVTARDTNEASSTSSSRYFLYMGNPDVTPPANITGFDLEGIGLHEISLTWTNPGDGDYHGILVTRSTTSISWTPSDDSEYTAGTEVSAGVYIVGLGSGSHSSVPYKDLGVEWYNDYYYKAFSCDEVPNYSSGVQINYQPSDSVTKAISGTGLYYFSGTGVSLEVLSLTGSDDVSVAVKANSFPPFLPTSGMPVKRYFNIVKGGGISAITAVLQLAYIQDEYTASNIGEEMTLYCARYDGAEWDNYASIVDTVDNTVSCTTGEFSLWGIGGEGGALPVSLSSFYGEEGTGGVVLYWRTESERDNLGWNVLRSSLPDGPFNRVNSSIIPGAGNTSIAQHYSFADAEVAAGWYYYRLEQVNVSGGVDYSDIIAVEVKPTAVHDPKGHDNRPPEITYSASPALVSITYHYANPAWDEMVLLDLAGHRLGGLDKDRTAAGGYTIRLAQSLSPGVYIMKWYRKDKQELHKLLIAE